MPRARRRRYPPPRTAQLAGAEAVASWDGATPPWPGESVDLPGGRTVHLRRTPACDGAPPGARFVYVHGLGGSATNWTDLAGLLSPLGDGIAIDLPGFGRSPAPADADWSQSARITTVIDALEHLDADAGADGEPVHLVGNSMGGAVALAVAALRPDLVRSLTLVSPAMPDLRIVSQLRRSPMPLLLLPGVRGLAEREVARTSAHDRVAATIALCVGDAARLSAQRIEAAEAEAAERADVAWLVSGELSSLRGLVRAQLRVGRRSMWALARRVQAPALVVWGGRDRLVNPDLAPRLCAQLPDARLLLLRDAGHIAMVEQPVEVARAVVGLVEHAARRGAADGQPGAGDAQRADLDAQRRVSSHPFGKARAVQG